MESIMTDKTCIPQQTVIENVRLARAYVPYQILCTTFTPADGLLRGTIFPPLWDNYTKMKGQMVLDDE